MLATSESSSPCQKEGGQLGHEDILAEPQDNTVSLRAADREL